MGEINQIAETDYYNKLIRKYKDKDIYSESELVEDIRGVASEHYFLPFVESFLEYLSALSLRINSKYLLKILIGDESRLYRRDIICNRVGTESDDAGYILVNDFIAIDKGTITKQLTSLRLRTPLNYIIGTLNNIVSEGIKQEFQYLFELIDKEEMIDLIYSEMDRIDKKRRLIELESSDGQLPGRIDSND